MRGRRMTSRRMLRGDKYERLNLVKQSGSADAWRVVLTDEGRYLADGIVTDLVLALD